MYKSGKLRNIENEMKRLVLSILGISELQWPGSGGTTIVDHVVYHSGNDDTHHCNGVAIIVSPDVGRAILKVVRHCDGIITIKTTSLK